MKKCSICDYIAAGQRQVRYHAARDRAISWGKEKALHEVALFRSSEGRYRWDYPDAGAADGEKLVEHLTVS